MRREVVGLNIIQPGEAPPSPAVARMRAQLRAADALVTVERERAEPEPVRRVRREAEALLREARYEEARDRFLDCIDIGLRQDYFPWQAAVNLVNCHRFLGHLDDAEATAAQLADMYASHPEQPIHYLLATQRGALAADRWSESDDENQAEAALAWARAAYEWQATHRSQADGLRAYNLLVALLRVGHEDQALDLYRRHEHDDDFQSWCGQGEHHDAIAALLGE